MGNCWEVASGGARVSKR